MDGEKANNGDDNNITPRMMVILAPSTPIMGMKPNFQKSMICSTKKKKKKKNPKGRSREEWKQSKGVNSQTLDSDTVL
jgi:hypothetical protein